MSSNDRHECEWVRERLDDFCDGAESELPDGERLRVARHLESCSSCARELALLQRVGASLRAMAVPAAPAEAVARAQQQIDSQRGNVVRLHSRARVVRWMAVAAALVALAAAVWMEGERGQNVATNSPAVEQAAQEAAIAFAYVNKYARRTGDIVQDEVIERRILDRVEKAMEKSGMSETKPHPDQS
jgi:anti-sigma factor RsiW